MNLKIEGLPPHWRHHLNPIWSRPEIQHLQQFLKKEVQAGAALFPDENQVFCALNHVDLPDVRVVILGQDPYHGPGQAMGLSFAVPNSLQKKPPSLKNIFKELESDIGIKLTVGQSDLIGWVNQGVLLLNTILTVEAGKPLSHQHQGWEVLTDAVIESLNKRHEPVVFILWGAHAQKYKAKINVQRHGVIESAHPSPLSSYRGFFGSKVFSKTNDYLTSWKQKTIDWSQVSISS